MADTPYETVLADNWSVLQACSVINDCKDVLQSDDSYLLGVYTYADISAAVMLQSFSKGRHVAIQATIALYMLFHNSWWHLLWCSCSYQMEMCIWSSFLTHALHAVEQYVDNGSICTISRGPTQKVEQGAYHMFCAGQHQSWMDIQLQGPMIYQSVLMNSWVRGQKGSISSTSQKLVHPWPSHDSSWK